MSEYLAKAAIALNKRESAAVVSATGLFFRALEKTSPTLPLKDTVLSHKGGVWGEESVPGIGYPVLRSSDMRGKKVDVSGAAWCRLPETNLEQFAMQSGDILVTKSSGSSDLVGKAALFKDPQDGNTYLFSNFTLRLRPDANRVLPEYLAWFLRSPQSSAWRYETQQTTVGLRNLQTKEYLEQELPVPDKSVQKTIVEYLDALDSGNPDASKLNLIPPLAEQQRIVARIEELARRVEEARGLRQEAVEQCDVLLRSIIFDVSHGPPNPTPMKELVTLREPDVIVKPEETYHFAGVYCFGKGVFKGQRKTGMEFAYSRLTRLHTDNFVYPKLMAWEGALGIVPPECDGLVVSTEYPVFEVNQDRALPETLDVYFRTPAVWPTLSEVSIGTNVRRRRLNPANFLEFKMPLPPMSTQLRLREAKTKVDELRRLQAETQKELDALMPSVLAKAFAGEL